MTLTEFLLARIAEDEAAARRRANDDTWDTDGIDVAILPSETSGDVLLGIGRVRVIAECEAKRWIMELHPLATERPVCKTCAEWLDGDYEPWPCPTVRVLAAIYGDHPDYDESWRP